MMIRRCKLVWTDHGRENMSIISSPCGDGGQMRDDPERTVVHANDDHAVVPVQTSLYQSLAGHLHLRGQLVVWPSAPLPGDNVAGLDGRHLRVGLGDLKTVLGQQEQIILGSSHESIKAQCHSHDNRDTVWSGNNNTGHWEHRSPGEAMMALTMGPRLPDPSPPSWWWRAGSWRRRCAPLRPTPGQDHCAPSECWPGWPHSGAELTSAFPVHCSAETWEKSVNGKIRWSERLVQKIKYRLQITKQWAGYAAQSGKQYFCGLHFARLQHGTMTITIETQSGYCLKHYPLINWVALLIPSPSQPEHDWF